MKTSRRQRLVRLVGKKSCFTSPKYHLVFEFLAKVRQDDVYVRSLGWFTSGSSPLLVREAGTQDIYALDWDAP